MTAPPSGLVAFLFTDVEGSTRLWERHPEAMRNALRLHDDILRRAIRGRRGYVFSTAGDAYSAAFAEARAAVGAALDAQLELAGAPWPDDLHLRVRMGIHVGEAEERDGDYFGPVLNRAARLMAAAHGGQILLSATAAEIAGDTDLGCELRDVGVHRLKDLPEPERIYQLVHPSLPSTFPGLAVADGRRTNLPRQTTSFVGRGAELGRLEHLVVQSPLVTLIGPGGAGKTRLAMHAGLALLDRYPDGVWFVDLAPLADARLVPHTVAAAIDAGEQSDADVGAQVVDRIARLAALVILDNCEHVVDAVAKLASDVVATGGASRLLATSREPLGVRGEVRYRLEPLPVPPASAGSDEVARSPAVHLFVERAAAVAPGFRLDSRNAGAVAEICRHLDGLPLAIELAAARVVMLDPATIAARLDDRFRLLRSSARDEEPRRRTLRAAIDWSYDLLTETERSLFTRAAVFAGGFSLEAAEQVVPDDALDEIDVLDGLGALVDKSLVRAEPSESETRFRMLESVREYALGRLAEAGGEDGVRRRHAEYFGRLATDARGDFANGREVTTWLDRFDRDIDDLREAMRWGLASEPAAAMRIAGGAWFYWYVRGTWQELRGWLERCLAAAPDDDELLARVLHALGSLLGHLGDHRRAEELLQRELPILERLGDRTTISSVYNNLANIAVFAGDLDRAIGLYDEALTLARELGAEQSTTLSNIAWTALDQGDADEARRRFEETVSTSRVEANERNEAWGVLGLAMTAAYVGDLDDADETFIDAIARLERIGEHHLLALAWIGRADIALDRGEPDAARHPLERALRELRAISDTEMRARWLRAAARLALRDGAADLSVDLMAACATVYEGSTAAHEVERFTRDLDELRSALDDPRLRDGLPQTALDFDGLAHRTETLLGGGGR